MSNVYDNIYTKKPDSKVTEPEAEKLPPSEYKEKAMYHYQRDSDKPLALMIDNGDSKFSFPYPYMRMAFINNQKEIEILYFTDNVIIKGKNLEPLFERIHQHKATYIRSANRNDLEKDYTTFIDGISVKER